jgi:hypothetical protein
MFLPAALAVAAAVAAERHLLPEQDANELGERHDGCRRAEAEARPVLAEPESDGA